MHLKTFKTSRAAEAIDRLGLPPSHTATLRPAQTNRVHPHCLFTPAYSMIYRRQWNVFKYANAWNSFNRFQTPKYLIRLANVFRERCVPRNIHMVFNPAFTSSLILSLSFLDLSAISLASGVGSSVCSSSVKFHILSPSFTAHYGLHGAFMCQLSQKHCVASVWVLLRPWCTALAWSCEENMCWSVGFYQARLWPVLL